MEADQTQSCPVRHCSTSRLRGGGLCPNGLAGQRLLGSHPYVDAQTPESDHPQNGSRRTTTDFDTNCQNRVLGWSKMTPFWDPIFREITPRIIDFRVPNLEHGIFAKLGESDLHC